LIKPTKQFIALLIRKLTIIENNYKLFVVFPSEKLANEESKEVLALFKVN